MHARCLRPTCYDFDDPGRIVRERVAAPGDVAVGPDQDEVALIGAPYLGLLEGADLERDAAFTRRRLERSDVERTIETQQDETSAE